MTRPRSRSSRRSPRKPLGPPVRRVGMAELSAVAVAPTGLPSTTRGPRLLGGQVDDEPIRAFLDGEYAQVVATVALVCGSDATAEDSVQEALAHAWERLDRGDGIDRLAAWVTTVALNLARSQMRRWRSERRARDRLGPVPRRPVRRPGRERRRARGAREALRRAPAASARGHGAALLPRPRRPRDRRRTSASPRARSRRCCSAPASRWRYAARTA